MTIEELVHRLGEIRDWGTDDPEIAHVAADAALIEFIGDERVQSAFDQIEKWYA